MQTIWTHILPPSSSAATSTTLKCGVIAVQSKSIYVGNPLQHYSYDPFGQNRNLSSPRSLTTQMKLSNNERFLAFASDIVDLMDLERAKIVRQFTEHTNTITGICNENSSPHIWATVGLDKTMRIFDSRQHPGQILCIRNDYRHRCITYAPNSQMLFCGGENIFIFDIRGNVEFNSIKTSNQVLDLHCHPFDCVVLGSTDDRMIKVWDIDTKECLTQSFPFESQPQKVLFEENGNAVITCTAEKLYTCGWEPFHVISQMQWSKSKQSKFMIMNGEGSGIESPRQQQSTTMLSSTMNTFDVKIIDGLMMHFGITETSKIDRCLGLRSVQVEHLLHPCSSNDNEESISTSLLASSVNDRTSTPDSIKSGSTKFDESLHSPTFPLQNQQQQIEDDSESAVTAPSPIMLSPTKTSESLIRKLPRSTSTSRSNLMKIQSPKKAPSPSTSNITVPGQGGPIRARSSSTNSLHASLQRTSSGGPEQRKVKEQHPQHQHLPPKSPHPRQQQKQIPSTPKPGGRRPSGCKSFEEMKQSANNFLSMVKNRKQGIQRIKAIMKSRNNNEDEVFDEAISLSDKTVFVHLLQQLVSKPINLKLAARILPEIRFLLSHKNSTFIDSALNVLDAAVTQLKESIKQGLASNAQSIGVDIAAEQRQLLCIKCKESLTEIYVNIHFLTAKFNEEQHLYFNSIVEKFMELVS